MDLERKYFVIIKPWSPEDFPGLVPRSRDEALKEMEECEKNNCGAYLVEIVEEAGKRNGGKIKNYPA